ncbi:MAG TPA: hypothetical protein PKJ41_00795 [Bryobacteraceae bacterium]|nr:hypothetical protein [Bryobacteraceae bacterium]HPT27938.1 hypothetical protein [Bryobacteraceae bacterium]
MTEQLRNFDVSDPFGRLWRVEFRWLQNAISIRHADAIDLKYYISDGEQRRELVVALPHASLLSLAAERDRKLTDAWCMRLGALQVQHMISTWTGMESPLITLDAGSLARLNAAIEASASEARSLAARTR